MKIITISRTLGSGGRELGRRVAELLGFDYYDREIIEQVAKHCGLQADYVARTLEQGSLRAIPLTFGRSFAYTGSVQGQKTELMLAERKVLTGIKDADRDCVIVGRNADVILADTEPFRVFVTATKEARIARCMARTDGEDPSVREVESEMRRIDKNRMAMRELITESRWGDPVAYHLTVNTTDWEIASLAPLVAEAAKAWWGRKK